MTSLVKNIKHAVASDIMSEEHTRDKYNEPDFLRFKAEIKTTIKNIRSHLFFLKLLGKKGIDLQLFSWAWRSFHYG